MDPQGLEQRDWEAEVEKLRKEKENLLKAANKEKDLRRQREDALLSSRWPGVDLEALGLGDMSFEQKNAFLEGAQKVFSKPEQPEVQAEPPSQSVRDLQDYQSVTASAETSTKKMTYREAREAGLSPVEIGKGLNEGRIV